MKARALAELNPSIITARDVAADATLRIMVPCVGCRISSGFNVWTIGIRLADTPLQRLRFRCRRCGVYPDCIHIDQQRVGLVEQVMVVPLKPSAWDEEHEDNQRQAKERIQAGRARRLDKC